MTDADPPAVPRPGTVHPHLARERALKVLFQADVRGQDPRQVLDRIESTRGALELLDELEPDEQQVAGDAELRQELTRRRRLPLDDYTRILVAGVASHRPAIDRVLEDVAERWTVARMPVVDRNLLRLAVYELALQDTPPAVVIDEAVSFAGGFAGGKARPFVNGVLETVRRRVAAGRIDLEADHEADRDDAAPTTPSGDRQRSDEDPPAVADAGPREPEREPAHDPASTSAWDAALDLLSDLDDEGEDGAY